MDASLHELTLVCNRSSDQIVKMARSSKPKPEDMMVVNVEDFLAQAQALGKQTEFIAAVLKHSEAICGTDVSESLLSKTTSQPPPPPASCPLHGLACNLAMRTRY